MAVQLRSVQRRDVPRLAVLLGQLGYPTDEAAVHERLDYWLDDVSSWLVGADDGGDLVGVAALHVIPMLEVTGRFGRLVALVVDDRYRGQGVGYALVTAVEQRAREAGCLRLEVTSSRHRDRAHAFYQRLGYEDASPSKARFLKDLGG
ncbi:N-acetylglutamate synthase-like GNAT family acetyltransferase [Micromonospora pisi]|uniref:N-acetylglutamate synthase-like GNAT family acetyltransferase n=1 Tax=Micromonospora pisi TaxID=589240 RepID=A0A495JJP1_9ACTN|nr:GNAT family N-acetyltransferase [Micromonospora pisi]RKR88905.1 N-acetylglutamate synthase-like GNAT family acetyltransferase [Micromonospora pisi]